MATVSIDWPRTWEHREQIESYAVREGRLERTSVEFQGKLGAAPLSGASTWTPGVEPPTRSVLDWFPIRPRFSLEARITSSLGGRGR